ncbi:MAG: ribosome small subunit-dependent GTPase A [Chromatiales bacterium]|nr:ribosome small subunit-dependent GTPase A [Chromatiales bacterium]
MAFSNQQLGWKPFFENQLIDSDLDNNYPVRISKIYRTRVETWSERGEQSIDIGLFSEIKNIAVGDWLLMPNMGERPLRTLDRSSELLRKAAGNRAEKQLIAANIDTLFIVTSCNQDFNESRIERFLVLATEARIRPVIVLTKADLSDDPEQFKSSANELYHDVVIEYVDARSATNVEVLKRWCRAGETVVLIGSSGVGKSTLINSLADAGQRTLEIRESDEKGRHTTTSRSLHMLHGGGMFIDTPGIRELQLTESEKGIEDTFDDVSQYFGQCKFRNCQHTGEKGCAIMVAIASGDLEERRWHSYLKLQDEHQQYAKKVSEKRVDARSQGRTNKSLKRRKK